MKEGWKIVKLGEVGSFIRGITFSKKDFVEEGFPCIHYGQIHMKFGHITSKHLSCIPESFIKKDRLATKGDLVIAITSEDVEGSCKCTAWLGDYDIAVGAHAVIFKHSMNPEFVSFYFKSRAFYSEKEKYTHGFKVTEIKPSDIAKIPIPLPPLSEQTRIVSILDNAFSQLESSREKAIKLLNDAKEIFQAQLKKEMTPKEGWEVKKIGEIAKTSSGATPLKSCKEYYENGNIPWLRSGEVCKKYINDTELFITELAVEKTSAKLFPIDSVVVAMYGATAGQVGILRLETTTNQAVCAIFPNEKYLPEFLYYAILSEQDYLVSQAQGGAQPNISQIKIKNLEIPFPNKSTQSTIVSRLDSLSANLKQIEEKTNKYLADLDELKQSLLKKAFEGKL